MQLYWQTLLLPYKHCRLLTPHRFLSAVRYCILASKPAAQAPDEKAASAVILEIIELESEKYRLGHTKARPGDPCLVLHGACEHDNMILI
ncbi:hypothetical protein E2C01_076057 [Portunus trituberculatus]|uniref:Uncharacterized protein n=1 Tax=Portunus trituberculatus TaxID=210409 RepID=A0A5B7I7R0_PORTR|nr:hypothetical protein [Portunus trituberculatus]